MTLETCYKRLEIAKARNNAEEVAFWEARIERKLRNPKYANLAKPATGAKSGKKSKG